MLKDANGGLDPSDVTEDAVKPIGSPSLLVDVIMATPEACILNTALSASEPSRGNVGSKFVISR